MPSLLSARLWVEPAAIATTPVRPAGTFVWPPEFDPQATTVPSFLRARLCDPPAAMATTFERPAGTVDCDA